MIYQCESVDNTSLISGQIKALRQARGWNQVELARRTGTVQTTISRIEIGQGIPRFGTLCRLAEAFEMDLVVRLVPREVGGIVDGDVPVTGTARGNDSPSPILAPAPTQVKRGRGRPRKSESARTTSIPALTTPRRGRGRPRKIRPEPESKTEIDLTLPTQLSVADPTSTPLCACPVDGCAGYCQRVPARKSLSDTEPAIVGALTGGCAGEVCVTCGEVMDEHEKWIYPDRVGEWRHCVRGCDGVWYAL